MSQNEAFHAICPSLSVKMALGIGLFCNALLAMGSERHRHIYEAAINGEASCEKIRTVIEYISFYNENVPYLFVVDNVPCYYGSVSR